MPESLLEIAELHPARDRFPRGVRAALRELNQGEGLLPLAWELAELPPGLDPGQREEVFLLILALLAAYGQGHTRLTLDGDVAQKLLTACDRTEASLAAVVERLRGTSLVGVPGDAKPMLLEEGRLYSQRAYRCETQLAERIAKLLSMGRVSTVPVPEGVFTDPVTLNEEQRSAVQQALESPLTLVTGGPGTGKTSIVVAILRALLHQPGMNLHSVALAAPTGKAGQRMGEAIRKALENLRHRGEVEERILAELAEPRTLHRLLAWHPAAERFRHDDANPLAAGVIIVDEASMISQEHMEALLRALAPGSRLILLGDADQLPSVESGRAFRDLVEALSDHGRRLRLSYRMSESDPEGRNILKVAGAVNHPGAGDLWSGDGAISEATQVNDLTHGKVELLDTGDGTLAAFLDDWFHREVVSLPGFRELAGRVFHHQEGTWGEGEEALLRKLFSHFERARILCVLREAGELRGVEEVNQHLHHRMVPLTGEGLKLTTPFVAGEPVMVTSNDYRRGVFNGDQGLVLKVRFDGEIRQAAVFPGPEGFRAFLLDALRPRLEHSYAITVHKAQGSEYERIAVVLPRKDHPALTRELLYTALTRARKSVILLGARERVEFARGNPSRRDSGLAGRLCRNTSGK